MILELFFIIKTLVIICIMLTDRRAMSLLVRNFQSPNCRVSGSESVYRIYKHNFSLLWYTNRFTKHYTSVCTSQTCDRIFFSLPCWRIATVNFQVRYNAKKSLQTRTKPCDDVIRFRSLNLHVNWIYCITNCINLIGLFV